MTASLSAQAPTQTQSSAPQKPPEITLIRKPGHTEGTAQVVLNGHTKNLANKATAAWIVQSGAGAVTILAQGAAKTPAAPCLVRYFDLNRGKGRDVGRVPFCAAELKENGSSGPEWGFALSGRSTTGQPMILVGG